MANGIQAYTSLYATRRVYNGPKQSPISSQSIPKGIPSNTLRPNLSPVTPLSAHLFGTWTALSAIVRLYAAYHVHDKAVYEIALWSFGVAWLHFVTEWTVFGSTSWALPLAFPVGVSTTSLIWMWMQYDHYVKT